MRLTKHDINKSNSLQEKFSESVFCLFYHHCISIGLGNGLRRIKWRLCTSQIPIELTYKAFWAGEVRRLNTIKDLFQHSMASSW